MRHGISAALLGVLILLPATPASAQSRNDFAYWATSGNGDLTCAEAEDRDEGLRLPAYRDNRDGTGIIYEWLERSRSSDGNNDGVACDSASNPNGYIPNAQVEPPVEPQGMLGGRGDMARVAGLRRTTTGRLRPRRLRDGLQQPGGRHHRGVAAHD